MSALSPAASVLLNAARKASPPVIKTDGSIEVGVQIFAYQDQGQLWDVWSEALNELIDRQFVEEQSRASFRVRLDMS